MIKNRTAQLIFQTIYCTLGLVGIIASLDRGEKKDEEKKQEKPEEKKTE